MIRSFMIYLSKASWARKIVSNWKLARRVASRFIAGETTEEALKVVKELNEKGINVTFDHLGENVASEEGANVATDEIIEILEEIEKSGFRAGVSIKLSQLGLALDRSIAENNLRRVLNKAKSVNNFVRIDMEDSPYTEATLDLFYQMMGEGFSGYTGIVVQAYLYRSMDDVKKLMTIGAPVRICKGAYKEPHEIAFPDKEDVDKSFDQITRILIEGAIEAGTPVLSDDGKFPPIPAIATHDEERIAYAKRVINELNFPLNGLEFQMLNGIRRDLQEQLVAEGYPVRIYVPYGTEWYPYFMRRLAERPANLWFFISNFFRN